MSTKQSTMPATKAQANSYQPIRKEGMIYKPKIVDRYVTMIDEIVGRTLWASVLPEPWTRDSAVALATDFIAADDESDDMADERSTAAGGFEATMREAQGVSARLLRGISGNHPLGVSTKRGAYFSKKPAKRTFADDFGQLVDGIVKQPLVGMPPEWTEAYLIGLAARVKTLGAQRKKASTGKKGAEAKKKELLPRIAQLFQQLEDILYLRFGFTSAELVPFGMKQRRVGKKVTPKVQRMAKAAKKREKADAKKMKKAQQRAAKLGKKRTTGPAKVATAGAAVTADAAKVKAATARVAEVEAGAQKGGGG